MDLLVFFFKFSSGSRDPDLLSRDHEIASRDPEVKKIYVGCPNSAVHRSVTVVHSQWFDIYNPFVFSSSLFPPPPAYRKARCVTEGNISMNYACCKPLSINIIKGALWMLFEVRLQG